MNGVCPECKVRDDDSSEKELYECPLCGRSFCVRHLDPRLAWFSARFKISEIIKDPVYRKLLEKELNLQDGHPCIPYTQRRLEELRLEQRRAMEMFNRFLDSGRRVHFRFPKAIREIEGRCVECGSSLIRDVETDTVFCSACGLVQEGKVEKKKARKKTHNKTFEENIEGAYREKHQEPVTVQYVPKKKRHIPARKIAMVASLFLIIGCAVFIVLIDRTPPEIAVISPEMKTYSTNTIALTYKVNEPVSWVGYSLDGAGNVTLTSNTTLSNLSPGHHKLIIYANDTAGNMGFSEVSFTVTRIFRSLNELVRFLREDNLSDVEWTEEYTCEDFAEDFIRRAEKKGYYCFIRYDLFGRELLEYTLTVETILVVKETGQAIELREYDMSYNPNVGHAVCRTTIAGMDVIIDPQTDIVMEVKGDGENISFSVLYEGEITQ